MTTSLDPYSIFQRAIDEHITVIQAMSALRPALERIASEMTRALLDGRKVLWCGNGGSAADSQHLAAELMGRFRRERCGLPSIALTTDTSALTAIGNDYGFDKVFERQVEALCVPGDVLVGISTSGNSKNVCAAMEAAGKIGAFTAALTGEGGGAMAKFADVTLPVPSRDTARIQEGHILCGHMLCDWVELSVCAQKHLQTETAAG
ncbi:MAG TPA: D-sedoheptulose 7-phosphate isomerase [Bryobacteraceae bacterium]|jgi:D-sedoheptulose 7-phosphate isomerase|nr:D-sedoheptulose 7-phosphate isomerase [Bryobacteraceae bacterium]